MKDEKKDHHRLRMCVNLHFEQAPRSNNFRIHEIAESGAVTKGKGQNLSTKRNTGECFQQKANGSCSRVESCSFLLSFASENREITQEEEENARGSGLNQLLSE